MERLLIVSNRLPVSFATTLSGLRVTSSVGGLATGLGSFYRAYDSSWFGSAEFDGHSEEEREQIRRTLQKRYSCYPVELPSEITADYYEGFCNSTLWPLFHDFPQFTKMRENEWQAYVSANERFADAVAPHARPGDLIWVHDYHLMLLPAMLRERLPDASVGFFLHIPFPPFELFRKLPWRMELLRGLLGADLVGFHTYDYTQYFLDCVHRLLGYEHAMGRVLTADRVVKADAFPMGIDYDHYSCPEQESQIRRHESRIAARTGRTRVILSIDRLDYTKGIPERLEAFDRFLENHPEYVGRVTLIVVAVPSRTAVDSYRLLKQQVDELVGRINGKYGTIGWMPVWYMYRSLPFPLISALYRSAEVCLVTPLRDGMNLIAKEYVASKAEGHGVLVLSETAGAARELGEAIVVNPLDADALAEAFHTALEMPAEEQAERLELMRERLERHDVRCWAQDFIDSLERVKEVQKETDRRRITREVRGLMEAEYAGARQRLLLLDYDGTLVEFVDRPNMAKPDADLRALLERLSADERNSVVVISGRDWVTLEQWLGDLPLDLVAEHGAWYKRIGEEWSTPEPWETSWKDELRPILERYRARTPGALIEEKDFSLAWHYRWADEALGSARALELKDALMHLVTNLPIEVIEGDKVIEVKNVGVNKGRAGHEWIDRDEWDFVLAIGDDRTDEDLFWAVPENAWTIKVGHEPSRAHYSVDSVGEVRTLLTGLEEAGAQAGPAETLPATPAEGKAPALAG